MKTASVILEECILQTGKPATAGAKMLANFIAPFDATIITSLSDAGYDIVGRASTEEFGIADFSSDTPTFDTSAFGEYPSAVKAVAEGVAEFALCNDVFGTQRREAAENGLCYIRPSYGTVSRFGLIPLVSSMDQIGIVCKDLAAGFELLSVIAGVDPNDGAMLPGFAVEERADGTSLKIGVPSDVLNRSDSAEILKDFAGNFDAVDMTLEYFDVYKQVMCILATAEISANFTRYDGIKFGYRASGFGNLEELYFKTRSEGFGPSAKFASIMGAMVVSKDGYAPFYEKALKIRRLIKDATRFDGYDLILLPTEINGDIYENSALYALAPLVGLPSVSFSYKGRGLQLIANVDDEGALLSAYKAVRI